ncbi:MAG TPA: sigma-70 family RNA polymerase sigma factor [Gaiella sp.]
MAVAPTRTDAELVRRLQARDRSAWEELYAEYQPRLRAFGYRLAGNAHDADDLVQETFVRALPALDRLEPDRVDLAAYLFATERNLFLKQVERAKRAEPTAEVPEPDLPTAIEDDPERSALLHRQQEEVRIANARLDPRQRLVLALCELEDRSYAEIGELVGLNENAVAQLVFRARERLRTELRLVQVDPERLPEECRVFLPLLSQHLDGKLRGPRRETTLAHLDGCERCQGALADMREAKRRYRALLLPPLGMSTEEARAATEADLERAGYWRPRGRGARLARPRGATAVVVATGAAALLVASGVGTATLLGRTTRGATPAPVTVSASKPTSTPATTTPSTSVLSPARPGTAKVVTKPKPPVAPSHGQTTSKETATTDAAPTETQPTVAASPGTQSSAVTTQPRRPPAEPKPKPKRTPPPPPGATTAATVTLTAPTPPATQTTPPPGTTPPPPPPDTLAPGVSFTATPPPSSTSRSARFEFTASEASVTFQCSHDDTPFAACASPHTVEDAGIDDHSLAVRATDAAGNVGAPAVARWTVTAPLPDLVAVLANANVTVTNAGEAPAGTSIVLVQGVGAFTIPGLGPGQSATRTYTCKSGTITAIADETKLVTESDEGNNTATRAVTCLGFT